MTICLNVKVKDGMFPSKKTVKLDTAEGPVSMFVAADKVRDTGPGRGQLCACDRRGRQLLPRLPACTAREQRQLGKDPQVVLAV